MTAEADADGARELVEGVPTITGTTAVTTADGTPLDVKTPTIEDDNSGGLSKLFVGRSVDVVSASDSDSSTEFSSRVEDVAEILDASTAEVASEG